MPQYVSEQIVSLQPFRAFFSEIAQGASAKIVWSSMRAEQVSIVQRWRRPGSELGSMRAEQVSIVQRWRRPRSDPEYRTRRSDTAQAAEKCSKRAFCPFLPRQTNFEYNARRAPDARNRRRHPPDSANNARISGEAKASPSRLPHLDSALRSPLPRT